MVVNCLSGIDFNLIELDEAVMKKYDMNEARVNSEGPGQLYLNKQHAQSYLHSYHQSQPIPVTSSLAEVHSRPPCQP
jgi:hypothetical protein